MVAEEQMDQTEVFKDAAPISKVAAAEDPRKAACRSWPTLSLAAGEIETHLQELDSILTLLESLAGERLFEDWFKVDCRPVKEVGISYSAQRFGDHAHFGSFFALTETR